MRSNSLSTTLETSRLDIKPPRRLLMYSIIYIIIILEILPFNLNMLLEKTVFDFNLILLFQSKITLLESNANLN
jgi:hypothetical protein